MVLRSVPVRALLVAEVVSTTGSQMTWLALPWFVLITTGSPKQMSFVVAAEVGAYALFGIPSGMLLARFGSRRTMLLCDAVRAPLLALVPVLHWTGSLRFGWLLAISFAIGLFGTPYGGAQRVIVPELIGEDESEVGRANALFQGATRITLLLGPALAGVLIGILGAPSVLVIDAATYVVSFLLVAVFVPPVARAAEPEEPRRMLDGLRFVWRDRLLRDWSAAIFLGDGGFSVIFVGIPVLVLSDYGRSPRLAGLLLASFGVGAVLGNVISYRRLERTSDLRLIAPWRCSRRCRSGCSPHPCRPRCSCSGRSCPASPTGCRTRPSTR